MGDTYRGVVRTKDCEACGKPFARQYGPTAYEKQRFCSQRCSGRGRRGPFRKRRDGSKYISPYGYVMVRVPDRKAVAEHILRAEKVLGRRLKRGECVHHVNGDKADNRNKNLLVCSRGYHIALHFKMALLYQRLKWGGQNRQL